MPPLAWPVRAVPRDAPTSSARETTGGAKRLHETSGQPSGAQHHDGHLSVQQHQSSASDFGRRHQRFHPQGATAPEAHRLCGSTQDRSSKVGQIFSATVVKSNMRNFLHTNTDGKNLSSTPSTRAVPPGIGCRAQTVAWTCRCSVGRRLQPHGSQCSR